MNEPGQASATIRDRQDGPEHHRRLLAYSHQYQQAARWHRLHTFGSLTLALCAPVVLVFTPEIGPWLGAIAAGYLVVARTLLAWAEQRARDGAALIQESYDVDLFGLPWNKALVGSRPSVEDIEASAERFMRSRRYRRDPSQYAAWYDVDLDDVPWPADALLCQRQSTVWSRRDHAAYAVFLWGCLAAVLAAGLATALARSMLTADYLVAVFLPTAPAALDLAERARAHWRHALDRRRLEGDLDDLWAAWRHDLAGLPVHDVRRVQDASYLSRRNGPPVPHAFYSLRRAHSALVTQLGVRSLRR